jgi:hypothetical protein
MNEEPKVPEEGDSVDVRDANERETEAAEAEARQIGGKVEPLSDDPAKEPGEEAGQGESEGFEQAERRLKEVAEHGDQHRFPDRDVPPAEEAEGAEGGESDETVPADG